jgi:proton-dependent oligopeptide transporter, POT family
MPDAVAPKPEWFGQPRGLSVLFLTDAWSQFSFYGMRTMLVYYMIKQLHMTQADAALVYGGYNALSNFTPLLGGMLADHWLGRRWAVMLGGIIMVIGHFMMASESLFYPALLMILVGFGLFMPNLPSQISDLYPKGDPRRSSAYNVYYAGINLGAFLAPLVCGTIGEFYGWHYGFAVAGLGMFIGMATYWIGGRYLPPDLGIYRNSSVVSSAVQTAESTLGRMRFVVLGGLGIALIIFRIPYEQLGSALAVWTDQSVDRHLTSEWVIPMTWFQAINPLVIVLMTPWIVRRWKNQAIEGREWPSAAKMAFGGVLVAISYTVLISAANFADTAGTQISWLWLVLAYTIFTFGEIYVFPVALGVFGRLAPTNHKATVIACYFVAAFFGNLLAGYVASYWEVISHNSFFTLMILACLVAALLFVPMIRPSRRIEGLQED